MAISYRVRASKSLFDEIDEIADALKDTMPVMVQNDMAITDDDLDLWRTQTQAFIERLKWYQAAHHLSRYRLKQTQRRIWQQVN